MTLQDWITPLMVAEPHVLHQLKRVVIGADDDASFTTSTEREQEVFLSLWGGPANRAALAK